MGNDVDKIYFPSPGDSAFNDKMDIRDIALCALTLE